MAKILRNQSSLTAALAANQQSPWFTQQAPSPQQAAALAASMIPTKGVNLVLQINAYFRQFLLGLIGDPTAPNDPEIVQGGLNQIVGVAQNPDGSDVISNGRPLIAPAAADALGMSLAWQQFIAAYTGASPPQVLPAGWTLTPTSDGGLQLAVNGTNVATPAS